MKITISDKFLQVYNNDKSETSFSYWRDTYILNAKIKHKIGYIEVTGDEVQFEYHQYTETENLDKYRESDIQTGNFLFFSPYKYVKGWVRLKNTVPYKAKFSGYKIEYMDLNQGENK